MDAAVEFVESPSGTLLIVGGKKPACYRVVPVPVDPKCKMLQPEKK